MLSPTVSGPRPDLTQIALGRIAGSNGFVLRRVLPSVPVMAKAGRFFKIAKGAMLGAPDNKRASGANFKRDNLQVEDDTFACENRGLEGQIPDDQAAEYADVLSLEQSRTDQKTIQMLRREDLEMFTTVFSRTTFPVATETGHDMTNEVDDHANSVPIDEIVKAKNQLRANIGDWTEMGLQCCVLMSKYVRDHLALCTQVRSGLGGIYTNPEFAGAQLSDALLCQTLGVDEVVVSGGHYQSAGTQIAPTVSNLANEEYMLVYIRTNPSAPELAGLGVTFVWDGYAGEMSMKMYREDQTESGVVQCTRSSVQKIIQSGAGYLIGNCKS